MRSLAAFAMAGRLQAVVAIAAMAAVPVMIWAVSFATHPIMAATTLSLGNTVSASLLALVTLRREAKDSLWVLVLSVFALGLCGVALTGNMTQGMIYGLLLWAPLWPVAWVLRETRSLGWALEAATGLGLAGVLAAYALLGDPAAHWREGMNVQGLLESLPSGVDAAMAARFRDTVSRFLTGALAGALVFGLFLPLLVGRWQQAVLYNPGGFRAEFLGLRLHRFTAYMTLVFVAVGLLWGGVPGDFGWNLTIVLLPVFVLGGFSVLHFLLAGKSFLLVGLYFGFLFAPQLLLPPIAVLGLSDVWMDWRKHGKGNLTKFND